MIGHLQTNKVKYIASFVSLIHSGASYSLLKEINSRASKQNRVIDVLLQIKIAQEESKYGWEFSELLTHLENDEIQSFSNIRVRGVMGMATFSSDENIVRAEFSQLKSFYDKIKNAFYSNDQHFDTVSMGMSNDYKIAVSEGATMVRIGSLLFQ
jgi:hypothetical protein